MHLRVDGVSALVVGGPHETEADVVVEHRLLREVAVVRFLVHLTVLGSAVMEYVHVNNVLHLVWDHARPVDLTTDEGELRAEQGDLLAVRCRDDVVF